MEENSGVSDKKILFTYDLNRIYGLNRATIYRWMAEGKFPRPVRLGAGIRGKVGWRIHEIEEWYESLEPVEIGNTAQGACVRKAMAEREGLA